MSSAANEACSPSCVTKRNHRVSRTMIAGLIQRPAPAVRAAVAELSVVPVFGSTTHLTGGCGPVSTSPRAPLLLGLGRLLLVLLLILRLLFRGLLLGLCLLLLHHIRRARLTIHFAGQTFVQGDVV